MERYETYGYMYGYMYGSSCLQSCLHTSVSIPVSSTIIGKYYLASTMTISGSSSIIFHALVLEYTKRM